MRPDENDLDEEIRGHLAISIKERIERGEDPAAARLAALKEFGNVTLTRDSMRGIWRHRWFDAADGLVRDIRFALRALMRVKGMAATVVVTLALGIGGGSFFDVMGLRPVLGRLLNPEDDGPNAAGAAVLTYRFWTASLNSDPTVIGKTIRLGARSATVVGVLEPSVPYPADTEIISNVVTSPHHLGATMVTSRFHRMTELFGRLSPGTSFEAARADLIAVHAAMMREHPEAYAETAHVQLRITKLRDQIAAPARTILLVLLAAAAIVFVIACSNVANLILARSVHRESELALR